ncbi:hypothetical protein B0H16DRAFT_1718865 [Mycena metata]|uniref:RNI-like protein n=1 Tax=Mycena metata TaxID=1033252 RepID=A0AAD7JEC1_9AGAR|nr:hypothetical protein B0H16DRAFT_1718865 [Mycena metata]
MSLHSPSLGPSSPSPSSSAVTIPIPGRSILKKPPPAQGGLLSRMGLGSFLRSSSSANASAQPGPSNVGEYGAVHASGGAGGKDGGKDGAKDESTRILKRAHFILPEIAVVYPISSAAPPSTPTLREEKRAIEEKERERRRRVVRSNSYGYIGAGGSTSMPGTPVVGGGGANGGSGDAASTRTSGSRDKDAGGEESTWWPMDKVESFYRECCEGCQEVPDKGICAAFKALMSDLHRPIGTSGHLLQGRVDDLSTGAAVAGEEDDRRMGITTPPTHPRTVSFSGVQLTPASAAILADVLSIEWGLRKVVWRECDLEEATLKPLLHALLIPRSLSFLSLQQETKGERVEVGGAHTLTFLYLSSNTLDKKAVECIVGALVEYVPVEQRTTSSAASLVSIFDSASVDSRDYSSPSSTSTTSYMNGSEVRYSLGYALDDKDKDARDREGRERKGMVSLKLDDCGLPAAALETVTTARAVRTSTLRNISLRHNKISPTGAVALALMIRDYPDVLAAPTATSPSSTFLTNSYSHSSVPPSPTIAAHHLDHLREHHHPQAYNGGGSGGGSGNASPVLPTGPNSGIGLGLGGLGALNSSLAHAQSQIQAQGQGQGGKPPPPPRHPVQTITAAQTTYTPYEPRRRQQSANAGTGTGVGAVVASSVFGGVTARHVPSPTSSSPASSIYGGVHGYGAGDKEREAREAREREAAREEERDGPSAALLDKVRALDALPRVGALRTLDLRGNDLRTGITYIAQVLKRNRTLKVLNLAENKLDVACLVSLAEALAPKNLAAGAV